MCLQAPPIFIQSIMYSLVMQQNAKDFLIN